VTGVLNCVRGQCRSSMKLHSEMGPEDFVLTPLTEGDTNGPVMIPRSGRTPEAVATRITELWRGGRLSNSLWAIESGVARESRGAA